MKNLFIILFFIPFLVYAQKDLKQVDLKKYSNEVEKGFIITKKNELKPGYILVKNDITNSIYVDYLQFKNATPKRLTKDDISGYGYEEIVYELVPYSTDSVFMQKINTTDPFLYYYKNENSIEFFLKKEGEFILLPENRIELISFLKKEFNSCNELMDQFEIASYNKTRLSNIMKLYSVCSNKKLPYFKIGVQYGFNLNFIKFNNNKMESYLNDNSPIVNLSSTNFKEQTKYNFMLYSDALFLKETLHWSMHAEIDIAKVNYEFEGDPVLINYIDFPDLTDENVSIDINYYNLDLFFRYNSLRKKLSFFTDIGPIISFNSSTSKLGHKEIDFNLNKFMLGIGGGIGLEYPIYKRHTINSGIRCSYLAPAGGDEFTKFKVSNVSLFLGLGF